jgi:hypothetical protein
LHESDPAVFVNLPVGQSMQLPIPLEYFPAGHAVEAFTAAMSQGTTLTVSIAMSAELPLLISNQ